MGDPSGSAELIAYSLGRFIIDLGKPVRSSFYPAGILGKAKPVTRSELGKRLTDDNPDPPAATARRIVDAIISKMIDGRAEGRRIQLRGFGAF
ncbi:HU family DNA-binding protein [Palleronia sp.]|uniref:HU family DNA-binding protein n=1 Tax=Palleronia sp. TaxID=1940284 RepID=UPI0035C78F1D